MRSTAIVLGAALVLSACGGAAQPAPTAAPTAAPTTPRPTVAATTPAPTPATQIRFTADLKAENEVPPVANDEKSASGKATVVFDLTRDSAGKITSAKVSIDATFAGLLPTTQIHIGHIHGPAPAGQNAGVKIGLKTDQDSPLTVAAGATTFKKSDITVDAAVAEEVLANPGNYYVNFHSRLNAGGIVRGQLVRG
jgi:hypothetical protein